MGANGTPIAVDDNMKKAAANVRTTSSLEQACTRSLVDPNLSPAQVKLVRTIDRANDKDAAHRAISAFFQGDDTTHDGRKPSGLMTDLLMECLPRFVHSQRGFIIHAIDFSNEDIVPAQVRYVEVNGESRPVLQGGFLFIETPNERAIVCLNRDVMGWDEPLCRLGIVSNKDASQFLASWEAFARRDNYLKNRAFFPDGTLWQHNRRYMWDDVILPVEAVTTIRRHTEEFLERRATLRRAGIKLRRGLMLEGPPGTGKTLLCKVLADQINASLMWITPQHVRSVQLFARHLEVARFVAPTIVFLEDIDLYAEEREARNSILLGELMGQLDGVTDNDDLIIIASTNRLHAVEQALRNRPGRFDRIIHFGALDEDCRRRLLDRLLKNASIHDSDRAQLIESTDGYTGAQLEELTNTLYMLAAETEVDDADTSTRLGRSLIQRALDDVGIQPKNPIGFK